MFSKLDDVKKRFEFLTEEISKPEIIANNSEWQKLIKEHNGLQPLMEEYENYTKLNKDLLANNELSEIESDAQMREMLKEENLDLREKIKNSEEKLKILLLPKDENDSKNVVMEIRGGAGGEESSLFAHSLLRMYQMYCDNHKLKMEVVDIEETELGGVKYAMCLIKGKNVYASLKYESGVHRVQRVPETESQGRVHTSTATVAILPEAEEVDIELDMKDIRIDLYRASGAGGQHVNKTESAIRLTHIPTGIVVACQDERSQTQNKEKAFTMLRSKLYDHFQQQKDSEYKNNRKSQIGTGDRSERIRTYNFPQGRVTDHRIGFSLYNILNFMDGDLDDMIEALTTADQQKKLAQATENN